MKTILVAMLGCFLLISCGGDETGPPDPPDASVTVSDGPNPNITQVDAAAPDAPLPPDAAPEAQPDAGSGRTPEEQHVYQLCQRVGLAFCEKFDQCGLQSLASCQGDFDEICAMSYRVRGEDALVDMCLPWIQTITCQQLIDPSFNLDPSCYHQFRGR